MTAFTIFQRECACDVTHPKWSRSQGHVDLQIVLTITKCFSGAYRGTFQEFYARIFCMLLAFDLTVPSEL